MHIDIDRYADLDTTVHRWDVRARLLGLGILLFCIAFTRSFEGAVLSLAVALGLTHLARIPLRAAIRRARWVFLILGPLAIALPFLSPEGVPRSEGWRLGGAILLRAMAIMVLTLPLLSTSRIAKTMAGLRALHLPARLATIFLLAYRYVFVILEDLRRMRVSMRIRGYEPRPGLRSFRVAAGQVGSLLVRSFERNDRIYHAMQVRGFRGEFPPPVGFRLSAADGVKSAVVVALGVLLIVGDVFLWIRY